MGSCDKASCKPGGVCDGEKTMSKIDSQDGESTRETVQTYYGNVLKKTEDLKTNACCTAQKPGPVLRRALSNVHEQVLAKYYGCGLLLPDELKGLRVLDLGCGAGRDVYVLAQFVGEEGFVMGVDMTDEQLQVANEHKEWHREKFGYAKGNVEFRKGYIEELDKLELSDNSFDLIISNCVINLSPDKEAVLKQAYRILKPGGELYFSDVYADRRVPKALREDPVLWGECLSGALYWNDFLNISKTCGFLDCRLVEDRVLTVENKKLEEKLGSIKFYSATYRLFKLDFEPACEDYGQAVVYKGTIGQHADSWKLDDHHEMETGKVFLVCGNTWRMLKNTRFASHFDFIGDFSRHYGIFQGCGVDVPFKSAGASGTGGCC
mmetsp:Transcript_3375/g.4883  ORF Transcript_3375/g.4883 Transcript_3375/m.4883 type:complete len:378 (+) Transcript_3375:75-1208(+)